MACSARTFRVRQCPGVFVYSVICFVSVSVCLSLCEAAPGCDKQTGPAGVRTCITSEGVYSHPQWATCLTNVYIQVKSGGRHTCFDPLAVYCYYQCMVEDHDVELGNVTDNCRCVPNATEVTSTSPIATTTSLPTWCLSPDGTDCLWFDKCFVLKYPCDDGASSYILHYAKRFCNIHGERNWKFSTLAHAWLGNVSKCLQASLVPLLRPFESPSCIGVRNRAFTSYIDCYKSPFLNAPSICDLPTLDFWKVFWTMKAVYVRAATPTLIHLLDTMKACSNRSFSGQSVYVRFVKILIRRINIDLGYSDNTTRYTADDMFVGTVSSIIAAILGWPSKGVGWFTTVSDEQSPDSRTDDGDVNATVVLSDISVLNVVNNHSRDVNMTAVVDDLTDAIRKGRLNVFVTDWPSALDIRHIYVCDDVNCNNVTYNTTTVKHGTSYGNGVPVSVSILINCMFWCFVIK